MSTAVPTLFLTRQPNAEKALKITSSTKDDHVAVNEFYVTAQGVQKTVGNGDPLKRGKCILFLRSKDRTLYNSFVFSILASPDQAIVAVQAKRPKIIVTMPVPRQPLDMVKSERIGVFKK